MVYRMSGTAFRVHCIYAKNKILLHPWPKSGRSQDKNNDTCQGSCNGLLGGWSHDQFPKMVKMKFVGLHCSFHDQLELCSKVLLLWRYEVKDFQKCCLFFCFLHFSQWKQHQITWFYHIWKAKERGYNYCTMGNLPKKEVVYPKREIGIDRL